MPAISVDTSRQTTPPLVDGVVHNRLVQLHHTDIRRSRSSSTSLTMLWYTRCMPCFVYLFSGFGSAKIIEFF